MRTRPPALVVTIDTEEEGLWVDRYPERDNPCRNIAELPRLHARLQRLGVRPTYLVDYPVATDARACHILRDLSRTSEIGAHLHPWCTPPLVAGGSRPWLSYPHQLPSVLQARKLWTLCRAIVDGIGVRPTSYRAGRWGFGRSTVAVLERLGFTVDTSVKPLWWDGERGGPSFFHAPRSPYRLDAADPLRPGAGPLLEVPLSAGFIGPLARPWTRVAAHLPMLPGIRRALVRSGLRALEPELYPLADLCALVDELRRGGAPVLNVAFHSSALLAGATPYARDAAGVDAFVLRVEGLLRHALRCGAVALGLSELPAYLDGAPASAAAKKAAKRAPTAASE